MTEFSTYLIIYNFIVGSTERGRSKTLGGRNMMAMRTSLLSMKKMSSSGMKATFGVKRRRNGASKKMKLTLIPSMLLRRQRLPMQHPRPPLLLRHRW